MKAIKYKKSIRFLRFLQITTSKYTIFITTLLLFLATSWLIFSNNNTAYLLTIFGHFIIWELSYKKHYNKIVPERDKIKIAIKILLNREKIYNI
ncbi:hypothetical protein M0Q97_04955 [Candidatus Dojkabacteria bacterium]|jgi:hypothetical protein|nr:hypothetical protein [Candidatus Dojkabacteria bacterium]